MFLVSLSHVSLFLFLLFPLSSQVNGGIENTLEKEVVHYDFYSSYFDIFVSIFSCIFCFRYDDLIKRQISFQ